MSTELTAHLHTLTALQVQDPVLGLSCKKRGEVHGLSTFAALSAGYRSISRLRDSEVPEDLDLGLIPNQAFTRCWSGIPQGSAGSGVQQSML